MSLCHLWCLCRGIDLFSSPFPCLSRQEKPKRGGGKERMPAGNRRRRRRRRTGSGTPPGWWVIAWAAEVGDGRTHGAPASLSPWMEQGAACWDGMGLATGGGEGGRGWNWPMGRQDALSPKRRRRRASPLGRSVSWLRLLPPFPSDPIDRPSPSRRTWWMPRRRGGGPPHWAKLFFTNMILH